MMLINLLKHAGVYIHSSIEGMHFLIFRIQDSGFRKNKITLKKKHTRLCAPRIHAQWPGHSHKTTPNP